MIHEFINMSDKITFYASNDEIARAVTLLLGNGKCGCKDETGKDVPYCFTAFGNPAPDEVYKQIEEWVSTGNKELIKSLNTVAVCDFSEREIYDDYTENSNNQKRWEKWDDKHRTSLNNFGKYARKLAKVLEEKQESDAQCN